MLYKDRDHKWVYLFSEGESGMKALLGGKGANVAEMARIGLPVPPGFVITTEACRAYTQYERQFPEGMWSQSREALKDVEARTGKHFGHGQNPLLVSVRSGAAVSMPGMMDTVLNLGLNDETVEGLARLSDNRRFALDAYRRFISMFGHIVMGVPTEKFDQALERFKSQTEGGKDTDLTAEHLQELIDVYKRIIFADRHGDEFPQDPHEQLRMAIAAVFDSWNGRRAVDYRRVHRIPDDLGTAVNVQAMVFGNLGWDSGTGVAFTRNPATGAREIFGEYLLNAQGEDVVAGIRTPKPIRELDGELDGVYSQLQEITAQLESHYRDMQDIEFTIEQGKLWMLQTRTGKRTGAAAVRIAVEMVEEGLIDKNTAVMRVDANQLDQLLHPTVDPDAEVTVLTTGLPASPGAVAGRVVLDPDDAEQMAEEGPVILVRRETSPDDFHGMVAAAAILTARGGMTSHAAVVARGMGKPCIVGADAITIDQEEGFLRIDGQEVRRGDWITLDGATGRILQGQAPTVEPELGQNFQTLMIWADEIRHLRVRANADTGPDAEKARGFGAEGIGLCRTEHMFFGEERLAIMREMILSEDLASRTATLEKLLPIQRRDFLEIFRAMDGLPVTIRLLDPPLHEFLPNFDELQAELYELKLQMQQADSFARVDQLLRQIWEKETLLRRIQQLREANPMLGLRGCRLGLIYPEVTEMQTRAIFEAACAAHGEGVTVHPEVMIPLVGLEAELEQQRALVEQVAEEVLGANGMRLDYQVGTMIELPRAALTANRIAAHADFFSFGTNDLTQTTFGLSRDDSGRFLSHYIKEKYLADDPFQILDEEGVGELVQLGVERGRATRPNLKIGICGEHGGEPRSVAFCHQQGLDYVSCSPFRVPIARLAAAQAALSAAAEDSDYAWQPSSAIREEKDALHDQ
ncbi:MAG TPA: pyruvate, phosphate dikinase [Candidatus Sulfomarinibacteraceae bacterium]|nr:pyruvate, phosphate dikinase [Candidatus Sulfomarinibacteraceae bacterium]